MLKTLLLRIVAYYRTPITGQSIQFFALTFPLWALSTYGVLQFSGFFDLKTYPFTLTRLILWLGIYVIVPSTLEESIYRPIFFPRHLKLASRQFVWRTLISTIIFMAMHPVTAYLFMPEELPVFSDWRFLTAVALLGLYCSVLLVRTKSIYFSILAHYVLVIAWKFIFCGEYVA